MGALDDFVENLRVHAQKQVPMQTAWVTVDDVTWTADEHTMDCTGVSDDLEYFDVLLGIGSQFLKPTKGSLCLIGTIANNDSAGYLISAAEVEEILFVDKSGFEVKLNKGELTLNGDQFGELMKIQDTVDKMNRLENKVNDLINTFNTHIHTTTATIGTGGPGVIAPTTTQEVPITPLTQVDDLKNEKIKHG